MWRHADFDQLSALDGEGRVVLTDHGAFVLLNLYAPCISGEAKGKERMVYKMAFFEV